MKNSLFLLICYFIGLSSLHATHIVGGEIGYEYKGTNANNENIYRITLKVYRDCYNGVPPFDNPASIGIFKGDNTLFTEILAPYVLLPDTLPVTSVSACSILPAGLCVEVGTYQVDDVVLPFEPSGYTIVYQRCCRNQIINNIVVPEDAGATYSVLLTAAAQTLHSSSPVWKKAPPVLICNHVPMLFDHSAIDLDGDSIVYKFCAPLNGGSSGIPQPQPPNAPPYDTIIFISGYSPSNPLHGDPVIHIDSITGYISGTPNQIGHFVFSVCGEEYRNGVLLSRFYRDLEFVVGDCVQDNITVGLNPAAHTQCDTLYDFLNILPEGGTPPYSYFWSTGETTNDIYNLTPGALYTVVVNDANSCTTSISLRGKDCVWPGDTDYDGIANNMDVLNIGLYYAAFGPARDMVDISWAPHEADYWTGYQFNGLNMKHVDCDGSGFVNSVDVNSISGNYDKSHPVAFFPAPIVDAPELSFKLDKHYLYDDTSQISGYIVLGKPEVPAHNAYGIAFTIKSDRADAYLKINADFSASIFGNSTHNVSLCQTFVDESRADLVVCNNTRYGFSTLRGNVCKINITSLSGSPGPVALRFEDIRFIDAQGNEMPINPISSIITVGQQEVIQDAHIVQIYPNPAADYAVLNIRGTESNDPILVQMLDVSGRVIRSNQYAGSTRTVRLDTQSLENGYYMVRVIQDNKVFLGKLAVSR